MSRPIKYQVWDRQAKTMYTHDMSRFSDSLEVRIGKDGLFLVDTALEDEDGYDYEVDAIFLQFTGLCDRNGKEIYEGDILRYPDAYMNCGEDGDWDETVSIGEVKWDNDQAQYYVTNRESIDMESLWEAIDEVEVLGSIYTHPHLMEVQA